MEEHNKKHHVPLPSKLYDYVIMYITLYITHKLHNSFTLLSGPLHPLRGCPRAWALEWERWISLRWLFGDSNTVVSSRWGLGGLRHFSGALRPFRHSSRGLPSGSAIWCPSSLRCAGAHYSGFVGRASSMWLLGEYGIFLFCSPRFWVVGVFLRALSS